MNTKYNADTEAALAEPKSSYARWKVAVESELMGASFEKKLVGRTAEGIAIQPLYTEGLFAEPSHMDVGSGANEVVRGAHQNRGTTWEFCQEIGALSVSAFNQSLLSDLARGQTSVALTPDAATRVGNDPDHALAEDVGADGVSLVDLPDMAVVLESVSLAHIPVHIRAGASVLPMAALYMAHVKRSGVAANMLTGGVMADPLGEWAERGFTPASLSLLFDDLAGWTKWSYEYAPKLTTVGVSGRVWHEAGGNAAQELAFSMAAGAEYLRELGKRGLTVDEIVPRMRFSFSIGQKFFVELAKFRSFRLLWARVITAFGGDPVALTSRVHASTGRWNKTVLDTHVNLLRVTTEALAAVLAGVDSLHIAPFDETLTSAPEEISRRIARNIHTLLSEEFRVTAPADPAGGSWYVEQLTDELARKAWGIFQEIEATGGYAAALREGKLQAMVAKSGAEKIDALDKRRAMLVGTNVFPNPKDKLPASSCAKSAAVKDRMSEIAGRRPKAVVLEDAATWSRRFEGVIAAVESGATVGQLYRALYGVERMQSVINPLKTARGAEGFECLRRAMEEHVRITGVRPKVFLAKIGPVKQHKPRADFSAGFFLAGGFEIVGKKAFDDAKSAAEAASDSGAPMVVLCSTDETYGELVPTFGAKLKALRPDVTLVLAGLPSDQAVVSTYQAAGVDEFIHVRANVREVLSGLLTKISAK